MKLTHEHPLCSKENGAIKVQICFCTVTKSFACVEDKWDINAFLFLALAKAQQMFSVINVRLEVILGPNQIKSWGSHSTSKVLPNRIEKKT